MDVLDGYRRLIHQNADGQRQSAQRHHVDRLPAEPQGHQGCHQRQRDVQQDDECARQSRRNKRIIRPTSKAPSAPSPTIPHIARVT